MRVCRSAVNCYSDIDTIMDTSDIWFVGRTPATIKLRPRRTLSPLLTRRYKDHPINGTYYGPLGMDPSGSGLCVCVCVDMDDDE